MICLNSSLLYLSKNVDLPSAKLFHLAKGKIIATERCVALKGSTSLKLLIAMSQRRKT